MQLFRTLDELAEASSARGRPGLGGVLVPTMGALHEGHAALIRQGTGLAAGRGWAEGCCVSIFVNPTQFNEQADFQSYPRTLDADLRLCEEAGASCVFAPGVDAVYPAGEEHPSPPLPAVATDPGLEDAHRPGHFAGVCQVVHRLFCLVRPRAAVFGEKDWQQLQVIRAMTLEQGLGVEIIPFPTVRERDGLAMSSRNRFLTAEQRERALAIPRALERSRLEKSPGTAEAAMREELERAGLLPEYAVIRDSETLRAPAQERNARAFIAARAGRTRLIDNMAWR
jgi:pantoate--beta-alanine ligase